MIDVAIVGALRTPIGSFGGVFRSIPVQNLAAVVLDAVIRSAGLDPGQVDEVIMGQAYQNGECANGARLALLQAGWPDSVTGMVVDRRCCSGLDAISLGAMKIASGNSDIVVAGGMESMSQAELYLPGSIRWGLGGTMDRKWGFMPRGHGALSMWGLPFYDRIQRARVMSQPIDRYGELNSMMTWAEAAAKKEGITREQADRWAVRSHQRAVAAMDQGKFKEEIVPVEVPQAKGAPQVVDHDEPPRRDTSLEKLARLKTVYPDGVCTAGNSSSENDGSAALLLMSAAKCAELGLEPLAYFRSSAVAGADPTLTYPAVPASVSQALAKAELDLEQIELIEIQEAFAVQCLADAQLMGLDSRALEEKVNPNGSGISLGHPIGATGAMRMVTLLHELRRRGSRWGLETICGGGGLGICAIVEGPAR